MSQPRLASLSLIIIFSFLLSSCESGPKGPARGSPEWMYQAAKISFRLGEMDKTHDQLEKLEGSGPFAARAAAWHMLLESGMILGPQDLADAYDKGAMKAGPKKVEFLREKNAQLKEARSHALHMLQAYPLFEKAVAGKTSIELEFPFPEGSGAPVLDLERIYKGTWVEGPQKDQMLDKALRRGILRGFSAGITSLDDTAGAGKFLQSGSGAVPAAKFWLGVGESMSRTAPSFDAKNINEPPRIKDFYQHAIDIAKLVREMKPDADIEKAAKKLQTDAEKGLKAKK